MFSIDVHTSPGPDGYGSNFSEKLVGEEVTNVVLQFIRNGKLPRKINSTLIALIPKVPAHQFADTQAVFVERRSLVHNVLIHHNLLRHYNRKTSLRCLMKIDLKKAYNMGSQEKNRKR
nr:uncharacterized protein LOC104094272 isoform X1 [Nicotiana tomentosiformis]